MNINYAGPSTNPSPSKRTVEYLLTLVLLVLALCMIAAVTGNAQTPPTGNVANTALTDNAAPVAATTPPATPATIDFNLTAEEQKASKALFTKYKPYQDELSALWEQLLTTKDEALAIKLWYKARLLNVDAIAIRNEFFTWFDGVRKAHKCPTCELDGNKLVLPKLPGQTPTTPATDK